uniref:Uncharacterized protein n=2 Tax=Oryza sativa subsp. japonica TaxID=39947 RepID=Q2R7Q4_ORYSJ|nr:hypothetical protein LOC_Os11g15320 [Oryza sativa Japonica Group]ABA92535.1 hypothetical protein LOC_Os11g15320 [Oryza sativa Japonica Group]
MATAAQVAAWRGGFVAVAQRLEDGGAAARRRRRVEKGGEGEEKGMKWGIMERGGGVYREKGEKERGRGCDATVGVTDMHPEENTFLETTYEAKQEMNIRSELQPVTDEKTGRVYLPPACHTLLKDDKITMLSCLPYIKVPSSYCVRIRKISRIPEINFNIISEEITQFILDDLLSPKGMFRVKS